MAAQTNKEESKMKYIVLGLILSFSSFSSTTCQDWGNGTVTCTTDEGEMTTCQDWGNGTTTCD